MVELFGYTIIARLERQIEESMIKSFNLQAKIRELQMQLIDVNCTIRSLSASLDELKEEEND